MRVYLAASENATQNAILPLYARKVTRTVRVLMSYYYCQKTDFSELFAGIPRDHLDIMADSGGFSAHSLGAVITVDQYAKWLDRWAHWFTSYINLDVKGDIDASLKNQAWLEARGFTPIPVYHALEPWSDFEDMVNRYTYIGLGSAAYSTPTPQAKLRWYVECFERSQNRRLHGFAVGNWTAMRSFPWYSVDSTTWVNPGRFGNRLSFDARNGKFVRYRSAAMSRVAYKLDNNVMAQDGARAFIEAERWLNSRAHGRLVFDMNLPNSAHPTPSSS